MPRGHQKAETRFRELKKGTGTNLVLAVLSMPALGSWQESRRQGGGPGCGGGGLGRLGSQFQGF